MMWSGVSLLTLLMVVILLLQLPYIQTRLVQKIGVSLSEQLGFEVSLEYINLKWFDRVQINGLRIRDQKDSTMIYIGQLEANFNLTELLRSRQNNLDGARLIDAQVNVYRYVDMDDININAFIKSIRRLTDSGDTTISKKPPVFSIDDIELSNTDFTFYDARRDSIVDGFDYYHFTLKEIDSNLEDFATIADTIQANITHLQMFDLKTGMDVKQMRTQFLMSQETMRFDKLLIEVGNSLLRDSLVFNYTGTEDFSYFNDSVSIEANIKGSHLFTQELSLFAPILKSYHDSYELDGLFKGKVTRFSVKDIVLAFGERSIIRGNVSFDGLPDFKGTFIDAKLDKSSIFVEDLQQYLVSDALYNNLLKFGQVRMNGQFVGFPNDFVTNAQFSTDLGSFTSDINLKIPEGNTPPSYSGRLSTSELDLGKWFGNTSLGTLTLNGQIDGKGLSLEEADFNLNSVTESFSYNGYTYHNITTDGRLSKELVSGEFSIDDPHLSFKADGTIDLRNKANVIQIHVKLDTANLKELNLTPESIYLKSDIYLKTKGLEIDSIIGEASLFNTKVVYQNRSLSVDSMKLLSFHEARNRTLSFVSNRVELVATGSFNYKTVYNDILRLVEEYKLGFQNDSLALAKYYSDKIKLPKSERYKIDLKVLFKNFAPILELVYPDLKISRNTTLEGSFSGGYTSMLSLNSSIDSVWYKNHVFYNNFIELNTSKISDSTQVLAMAFMSSEKQEIEGVAQTKNLVLDALWDNRTIDFQTGIEQFDLENEIFLKGQVIFQPHQTAINISPSFIKVLDEKWNFSENGSILIADSSYYFKNIALLNQAQQIRLDGSISKREEDTLALIIENTKLESFNTLIDRNLYGTINASGHLQRFYNEAILQSKLQIDDLRLDDFLIGNVTGGTQWINQSEKMKVNFDIIREKKKIVSIAGFVVPKDSTNQLDLIGKFNDASLRIAEPFLSFLFTDMDGTASGSISIKGRLNYPILEGEGLIENGGLKLNYLNTFYNIAGKLIFTENSISMKNVELKDYYGNTGSMSGGIFHDGFTNFVLDLHGTANKLMLLNTTSKDNSLYYGTAFATGRFEILGSVKNLQITANARSEKGTKMFIPVSESTSEVVQEDFINFVSHQSKGEKDLEEKQDIDLSGIKMDFDLELTPDAVCEIIFDIKTGDIIRARGNGKIKLQIDTNGEFFMFGNYEIEEGGYNFTLYNIINKEFQVKSGSTVNWYGDPYAGILDLSASYLQMASLAPLLYQLDSTQLRIPEIRRRYPSTVELNLKGPLLSPEISFGVDVKDYPQQVTDPQGSIISLGTEMQAFKNRLQSDEQELNRQVFSLIILKRFSSSDLFSGQSGSLGSSVSEFLSNQLSYWITQFDENLEIDLDVDLSTMDSDALNTFQLRLSYSLLGGRLRVSRDGGITSATQNEGDQTRALVGDWTLEYLLTSDGKFRAKMYNRTNYNSLNNNTTNNSGTSTTTGLSLMYVESFDQISEIWRKSQKQETPPEEEEDSDADDNPNATPKKEDEDDNQTLNEKDSSN